MQKFSCPKVRKERDGKIVDARCHALIAPHVRERYASDPTDVEVSICNLYEEFDRNGREGGRDSVFSREKSYSFPGTDIHPVWFITDSLYRTHIVHLTGYINEVA